MRVHARCVTGLEDVWISRMEGALRLEDEVAPPAGFEPALPAPEADALSPELWGLRDVGKSTSERALVGHAAR
jgi:hypothetical protein